MFAFYIGTKTNLSISQHVSTTKLHKIVGVGSLATAPDEISNSSWETRAVPETGLHFTGQRISSGCNQPFPIENI